MEGNRKKLAICYSGGLDSYLMWKLYNLEYKDQFDCVCVFYDIGQPYLEKEMQAIKDSGVDVTIRHIDWLSENSTMKSKSGSLSGNIFIPGRNAVLATLIACQEEPDEIWLGALQGEIHDKSTDKNYEFINRWNHLMQYVLQKEIKLRFPFADMGFGKFEIVQWALDNKLVNSNQLLNTSSCLSGEKGKCGKCVVCFRRWGIYNQLNINEKFNVNPIEVPENRKMLIEMLKGELGEVCHYDKFRRREIVPYALKYFNLSASKLYQKLNDEINNNIWN